MQHETILYRRDPARNMARFYALQLLPTLFGGMSLTRRWGRIGTCGRTVVELHPDRVAAERALIRIAAGKLRRGYRAGEAAGKRAGEGRAQTEGRGGQPVAAAMVAPAVPAAGRR